jgi:putative hydrolase of the HAD superfamily
VVSVLPILFDLDDTLVVEEPAAQASFEATARFAEARHPGIDTRLLAGAAREHARELWYASPTHEYGRRIGISSWEALWCRFEGDGEELRALRGWLPTYRRETWRLALAGQGIDDPPLAGELGERFGEERRRRHEPVAGAAAVLDQLGAGRPLALVTNGATCLQREKLAASGLEGHFDLIVVSAEVGVAKPDAAIFEHVLATVEADRAVMVGDSLVKDVEGALAAGLDAVWLNRAGAAAPPAPPGIAQISTLTELPDALAAIEG